MEDFARSYHNHQHRNSLSFVKRLFSVFLFFSVIFIFFTTVTLILITGREDSITIVSPLAAPIQQTYASIKDALRPSPLSNIVQETLKDKPGTYAVVIKNLQTGEEYMLLEHHKFASASLYKLWTMATAYKHIEQGTLQLEDKLTQDAANLNKQFDIASESAEIQEGAVAMTVNQAIEKAITISHNYAALLLSNKVKISNMSAFLKETGMTSSNTGIPPKTTAYDTAVFYEKLYNKELISAHASDEMLAVLKRQQLNDRIPKYLPPYVQVAHKTGELDGVKHDAGIVFTPQGDYLFVVLTDTTNPSSAAETTAILSQKVYDYFASQ